MDTSSQSKTLPLEQQAKWVVGQATMDAPLRRITQSFDSIGSSLFATAASSIGFVAHYTGHFYGLPNSIIDAGFILGAGAGTAALINAMISSLHLRKGIKLSQEALDAVGGIPTAIEQPLAQESPSSEGSEEKLRAANFLVKKLNRNPDRPSQPPARNPNQPLSPASKSSKPRF